MDVGEQKGLAPEIYKWRRNANLGRQNVIALDLYLAYLRQAFNTCYYCASITDHVEELQRKCIKHVRKPMSKAVVAEIAQQMGFGTKDIEEDKTVIKDEQESAEKPKDPSGKDKAGEKKDPEGRDWKRNGIGFSIFLAV